MSMTDINPDRLLFVKDGLQLYQVFFYMRKRVKKMGKFKTFAFDCLPSLFNEIEV